MKNIVKLLVCEVILTLKALGDLYRVYVESGTPNREKITDYDAKLSFRTFPSVDLKNGLEKLFQREPRAIDRRLLRVVEVTSVLDIIRLVIVVLLPSLALELCGPGVTYEGGSTAGNVLYIIFRAIFIVISVTAFHAIRNGNVLKVLHVQFNSELYKTEFKGFYETEWKALRTFNKSIRTFLYFWTLIFLQSITALATYSVINFAISIGQISAGVVASCTFNTFCLNVTGVQLFGLGTYILQAYLITHFRLDLVCKKLYYLRNKGEINHVAVSHVVQYYQQIYRDVEKINYLSAKGIAFCFLGDCVIALYSFYTGHVVTVSKFATQVANFLIFYSLLIISVGLFIPPIIVNAKNRQVIETMFRTMANKKADVRAKIYLSELLTSIDYQPFGYKIGGNFDATSASMMIVIQELIGYMMLMYANFKRSP